MKNKLERKIGGSESKKEVGEKDNLTVYDRLWSARGGWYPNSYGPTALHMRSYDIAKKMNTVGHLIKLVRTSIGSHEVSSALTIEDFEKRWKYLEQ